MSFSGKASDRILPALAVLAAALLAGYAGAQETSSPPGPAAAFVPAVLGIADGEQPGVRFEIIELARAGRTLTLKMTLVNESASTVSFGYAYGHGSGNAVDFSSIGGVHLIDAEGGKKYLVVRDAAGKCLCSQGLDKVQAGERINLWAKFPAPPEEVKTISVVIPHAIPLDDVPIS